MKPVSADISLPKLEENILQYWREKEIFKRSCEPVDGGGKARPEYVFYDGPPFATGLPHYGHLLAGTIKDVIGRFFTMKGNRVDRRFGWDCHGVPVEFEIQKALKLDGAKAIKEFGIGNFNEECRKIVQRYTEEWKTFVERSGRWVDFDRQYLTMDKNFMESIWWVVKSLWERGLIYEGDKVVSYSCGMNTPLSNFEANLNYKTVQDPAVTVKAKLTADSCKRLGLKIDSAFVYVWTTTPWTLPGNLAIAAGASVDYTVFSLGSGSEIGIMATALYKRVLEAAKIEEFAEIKEIKGSELIGLEYEPLFKYFAEHKKHGAFKIYGGDFVKDDEGTGLVHLASFGEDDVEVFKANGIPNIDTLDEEGRFKDGTPEFAGLHFKAADPKIIADLKARGHLVLHQTIEHSYPFCWRTDTPLIYRPVKNWFVRVEQIKDLILQANSQINWVPGHLKDGRFGKWLEGARDWAISRDRYWGTPIPIWKCDGSDYTVCIGSVEELEKLTGKKIEDLHIHFIDDLTFPSPDGKGTCRRIPQVLDCWFESGAMPYAQAHYPFEGKESFEQNFPADFIAEGIDQTRGWFYTLLVLSSALFGRPAFKNVIVNGIVLAEDGKKMSKSLKNYPPPEEVMNDSGADAMRLYLLASAATKAEELRFSKEGVRHVVRSTLLPLWNAYNFLVTYALVDGWTPENKPKGAPTNVLDRWMLSKISSLVKGVDQALGSYHLYTAAQPILDYVDQLTNWYIRLNRRRFWAGNTPEEMEDKLHAYTTLHTAILQFVRVLAPLAPFISEEIFLNLSTGMKGMNTDSVHLTPFPTVDEVAKNAIDESLEHSMELFEDVILLARTARNEHNLKVRQPLSKMTVIYPDADDLGGLKQLESYLRDELNIKSIEFSSDEAKFVELSARLNTKLLGKTLGPRLGRDGMKQLQDFVGSLDSAQIKAIERGEEIYFEGIKLGSDELLVDRRAAEGATGSDVVVASSGQITIVLDTKLTDELRLEGYAREFVNRVQRLRKDLNFDVADRISIRFMTACSMLPEAVSKHSVYISEETLAIEIAGVKNEADMKSPSGMLPSSQDIEGKTVIIALERIQG